MYKRQKITWYIDDEYAKLDQSVISFSLTRRSCDTAPPIDFNTVDILKQSSGKAEDGDGVLDRVLPGFEIILTRGWFYSLLAVSTTVFDSTCYHRCLSLGHILDSEGKKMSKSKGNVVNPWDHFNKEGADAIRWYMTTQSAPWSPMNFDPNGVRETMPRCS